MKLEVSPHSGLYLLVGVKAALRSYIFRHKLYSLTGLTGICELTVYKFSDDWDFIVHKIANERIKKLIHITNVKYCVMFFVYVCMAVLNTDMVVTFVRFHLMIQFTFSICTARRTNCNK